MVYWVHLPGGHGPGLHKSTLNSKSIRFHIDGQAPCYRVHIFEKGFLNISSDLLPH